MAALAVARLSAINVAVPKAKFVALFVAIKFCPKSIFIVSPFDDFV